MLTAPDSIKENKVRTLKSFGDALMSYSFIIDWSTSSSESYQESFDSFILNIFDSLFYNLQEFPLLLLRLHLRLGSFLFRLVGLDGAEVL